MKSVIFTVLIPVLFSVPLVGQDTNIEVPDSLNGWEKTWDIHLNGSQASYSNWSQGGTSNISATSRTTFTLMRKVDRFTYAFQLEARYGGARVNEHGLRKTADRLVTKNRLLYDLRLEKAQVKIFSNINFRTQFDKGYEYGGNEDGSDKLISRFLAPAYFNQNAGLAYLIEEIFSFEAGVGLQQKIIRDSTLAPIYDMDPDETISTEAGFTLGSKFEKDIATNVEISTALDTFTNMKKSVLSTDVYFSNSIVGKINSNMNASFNLELVYDDSFSKQIQLAQVISLGLSYSIH